MVFVYETVKVIPGDKTHPTIYIYIYKIYIECIVLFISQRYKITQW